MPMVVLAVVFLAACASPTPTPTPFPTPTPTPTPAPPDAPTAPMVKSLGTTVIEASWEEPVSERPVREYEYRFRTESRPWVEVLDTGHVERRVRIVALTPDTTYGVQVRALKSAGTGGWSAT
ncbi:MAG: fibronectin type III domain-containing protein, partial [Chloroflexi bacterium]|nr:fibronectin type III domain-containing protein [Chloroflexota bacterium]